MRFSESFPKVINNYVVVIILVTLLSKISECVKCLDCVGRDCMGGFCEGKLCIHSLYAPRWGTIEWGEPKIVKGCLSGKMIANNVQPHCETADKDGQDIFTCFCDKDYCNSDPSLIELEPSPVDMVRCICNGAHCKSRTCYGELCSYVINHRTKKKEQGCVNASVPLIERRSAGSCMIPPITGAMHHTVSKDPHDLLATESCVCATDLCNIEKPEITVPERTRCQMIVTLEAMGTKVSSRVVNCTGEFCFKASIKSKLGHMTYYRTMGCASFIDDAELAEELEPVGCAKFESEKLEVESCFKTTDKQAIGRARARQEEPFRPSRNRGGQGGRKLKKPPSRTRPTESSSDYEKLREEGTKEKEIEEEEQKEERESDNWEEEQEQEDEEEEEEEEEPRDEKEQQYKAAKQMKEKSRISSKEDNKESRKDDSNEGKKEKDTKHKETKGENEKTRTKDEEADFKSDEDGDDDNGDGDEEESEDSSNTTPETIFEAQTLPQTVADESNAGLIAVFVLLILFIVLAGIVWKLGLHRRLLRANYDTVAGG